MPHEAFLDMNLNSNVDQLIVVAALQCGPVGKLRFTFPANVSLLQTRRLLKNSSQHQKENCDYFKPLCCLNKVPVDHH